MQFDQLLARLPGLNHPVYPLAQHIKLATPHRPLWLAM